MNRFVFSFLGLASLALIGAELRAAETVGAEYTVTIPTGTSMLANHLNRGSNTVSELLPNAPEGTLLYKFDADRQIHSVNQFTGGGWTHPNETLAPGEGAMIQHIAPAFSVTFSGTAPTNTSLPPLVGGYNWVSFPSAEVQEWPPALDGDVVHRWNGSSFSHFVYDSLQGGWFPSLPTMSKGEAFVYFRAAPLSTNAVEDGTIYLNNRIAGVVDAPMHWVDWAAPGTESQWQAELVLIDGATQRPLSPRTTFLWNSPTSQWYVKPVVVTVPRVLPGRQVSVTLRVFGPGCGMQEVQIFTSSIPVTVGGGLTTPGLLRGLQGATLAAIPPAKIVEQPKSVTISPNGEVQLRVGLNHTNFVRFQWEKDGVILAGETNAVLELSNVQPSDVGSYRVNLSGLTCVEQSMPATVSLLGIDVYPGLTITGPLGARYRIEYSLEVEQPTWHPLTEVTLPSSPYTFADVTAPARTKRFYRAVLIPPN